MDTFTHALGEFGAEHVEVECSGIQYMVVLSALATDTAARPGSPLSPSLSPSLTPSLPTQLMLSPSSAALECSRRSLAVSALDVDHLRVWRAELDFNDVRELTANTAMEGVGWEEWFGKLSHASQRKNVFVDLDKKGTASLSLWWLEEGAEQLVRITLPRIPRGERSTTIVREMTSSVVDAARQVKPLIQEKHRLQEECDRLTLAIEASRSEAASASGQIQSNFVQIARKGPRTRAQKRKPGYSLVNPSVKRRRAKGTKIGTE
eukprot:TRINITY_DN5205_c0_g1_i1.p1 TRINITY_DN5205_c0_g1~~TRINITY_DN5205_c0_g1_i1.p1  ORF type:complete len:305 (+),score=59.43 TRINITY_DN5205_c0_g1_i1:127-915(+)